MAAPAVLIGAWARSAIVPKGGAFAQLAPDEIGAPVVRALLARAGMPSSAVDAVVAGNALGAGGNPARLVSLAAGLPDTTAAITIDTQCCAGLDAVAMAVGMVASGQASVVVAGGVEAWSRAPIRQHRPRHAGEMPLAFERPAFAPQAQRDPDMLVSAAQYALSHGITRTEQDGYAMLSHRTALAGREAVAREIVPVAGVDQDAYPRELRPDRVARMRAAVSLATMGDRFASLQAQQEDCSVSAVAISAKADGAAFVLVASAPACARLGLQPRAEWVAAGSAGVAPETPLLGAAAAARQVLRRVGLDARHLQVVELHDAFAVQGISFCRELSLEPERINRRGGGLARGHPIGASGAVTLVRLLAELDRDPARSGIGLAAAAAAGGIGAAAVVRKI